MHDSGWTGRLPDGMAYRRRVPGGFELGVEMPVGDDGMSPCQCPNHSEHQFKVTVTQSGLTADTMHCPYCGRIGQVPEFMPQQMARAQAAVLQAGTQYMQNRMDQLMRNVFGGARSNVRGGGFGLRSHYRPGSPLPTRPLPTVQIEPTREVVPLPVELRWRPS